MSENEQAIIACLPVLIKKYEELIEIETKSLKNDTISHDEYLKSLTRQSAYEQLLIELKFTKGGF